MGIKKIIKKIVPNKIISFYHFCLANLAALWYGFPSREMVVIGVVGTKGKTSTCNFIHSVLSASGNKAGMISTANIKIGDSEILNTLHMTMPGRFLLQKTLFEMVKQGCKVAVIETSSEGIKQFRHKGIEYDVLVFTNLSEEHLASHNNSFEKYRETKGKVFADLIKSKKKFLCGMQIKKMIVANFDDQNKDYFLNFDADQKITFGIGEGADFKASILKSDISGVDFRVGLLAFHLKTLGEFNVYNALPAVVLSEVCSGNAHNIQKGFDKVLVVPGRMEKIEAGQGFIVLVDYAHERNSMGKALLAARKIIRKNNKVIVLLGAEGGGRDKSKRPQMGEAAGKLADFVVVSNVDPYDDDPQEIIQDIAIAVEKQGKARNKNLFCIEDRREGIRRALSLAKKGDIVLITGKGAEQAMIIGKQTIPWDDRKIAFEELNLLQKI